MKKHRIIAVDADEIIAAFIDHFLIYYNNLYKTSTTKSDILSFELGQILNISQDEVEERMNVFYETREVLKVEPVKDSISGINELLKRGYEIHVITARPNIYQDITLEWINKFFPYKFKTINFAFNPYNRNSGKITKSTICKNLGATLLIEDNIINTMDCSENGINVLLFDAPWNQVKDLPENVTRVKSWKEILENLN